MYQYTYTNNIYLFIYYEWSSIIDYIPVKFKLNFYAIILFKVIVNVWRKLGFNRSSSHIYSEFYLIFFLISSGYFV